MTRYTIEYCYVRVNLSVIEWRSYSGFSAYDWHEAYEHIQVHLLPKAPDRWLCFAL